jgi:hypothetical protein
MDLALDLVNLFHEPRDLELSGTVATMLKLRLIRTKTSMPDGILYP